MITLTLTRDALSLADLVIDSNPFTGSFHIPEEGIEWPRFEMGRGYAPPSGITEGLVLLAAGRELGSLTATIYAHGDSAATLVAAMAELDVAVRQFSYSVTLEVDSAEVGTWLADPETPDWGEIDSGMSRAFMARGTITFPLHPDGGL